MCPQHSNHRSRRKLSISTSVDESFTSKYTQNGPALALIRETFPLSCSDCAFFRSGQDCKCLVIPLPDTVLLHALQTPFDSIAISHHPSDLWITSPLVTVSALSLSCKPFAIIHLFSLSRYVHLAYQQSLYVFQHQTIYGIY